jgi:hypothetical protein
MQVPMSKPFKALGPVNHRVAISSRIREIRENLYWILKGTPFSWKTLKRYLWKPLRWLWTGREIAEFPLEQAVEVYARLKTGQIPCHAVLLPGVA